MTFLPQLSFIPTCSLNRIWCPSRWTKVRCKIYNVSWTLRILQCKLSLWWTRILLSPKDRIIHRWVKKKKLTPLSCLATLIRLTRTILSLGTPKCLNILRTSTQCRLCGGWLATRALWLTPPLTLLQRPLRAFRIASGSETTG